MKYVKYRGKIYRAVDAGFGTLSGCVECAAHVANCLEEADKIIESKIEGFKKNILQYGQARKGMLEWAKKLRSMSSKELAERGPSMRATLAPFFRAISMYAGQEVWSYLDDFEACTKRAQKTLERKKK